MTTPDWMGIEPTLDDLETRLRAPWNEHTRRPLWVNRQALQAGKFAQPHPMTEPDVSVREIDQELWEAHLSEIGLMPRVLWERRWLADFEPMRSKYLHAGPRPDFVSPVRWRD